jgi:hypothetical protein
MTREIGFGSHAQMEFHEAVVWYEDAKSGLGEFSQKPFKPCWMKFDHRHIVIQLLTVWLARHL